MIDRWILSFLRLFPQYQALETEIYEAQSRRAVEDSRFESARAMEAQAKRVLESANDRREENQRLQAELDQVRDAYTKQATQNTILEDRLDAALADKSRMWDLMSRSIEEMKISYQMHINVAWQKQSGGVPYPSAPHLPESAVPKEHSTEPAGRRELPSEAIARRTNAFLERVGEQR
jgi:hypothetical protein